MPRAFVIRVGYNVFILAFLKYIFIFYRSDRIEYFIYKFGSIPIEFLLYNPIVLKFEIRGFDRSSGPRNLTPTCF
jgi:hypothetical protein